MSDVRSLEEQLEALRAENAKLKAARVHEPTLKVSEKGGISVYGLGRYPVSLYRSQMEKLLSMAPRIHAFIAENEEKLAKKA